MPSKQIISLPLPIAPEWAGFDDFAENCPFTEKNDLALDKALKTNRMEPT